MNNNWVSVEDRLPDRQDEYLILWTPKNSKSDNKFKATEKLFIWDSKNYTQKQTIKTN